MMNKKVLTLEDEPIASIYYTMKECNKKMGAIIREHRPSTGLSPCSPFVSQFMALFLWLS